MPAISDILTDEQTAAAHHSGGHARIVAVAGAGKTATLTHYLARRIHSGAAPDRLLVLMYNRAAQQNFHQRLRLILPDHQMPNVRTFHSLGLRLYQRLVRTGALPSVSFSPMAEAAMELKLKQLLQALAPGESGETMQEWLELTTTILQRAKSEVSELDATIRELADAAGAGFCAEVIRQFERWRRAQGLITFDDMLYDPVQTFIRQPQTRALVADRLDEILVDEYQDVNPVQHQLLQVLAGRRAQVMVIGDPDQTIYEFRGSSPEFITRTFAQNFPTPTTYCLSRTFRFGHSLALLANHLIGHNQEREPILTLSAPGTPNTRIQTAHTAEHGVRIATTIARLRSAGAKCNAMAVLCRLWSYARPVELELLARGIPYRIEGEQSILQCREIKPFWHCLELLSESFFQHPLEHRQAALFDLLTTPSGKIPHTILHRIAANWVQQLTPGSAANSLLKALPLELTAFQRRSLQQLADALSALGKSPDCAKSLLSYARALDYQRRLLDSALNPTRGQEQAATVDAFLRFILHLRIPAASGVLAFLHQIQTRQQQQRAAADAVTLTTVHRAKGLEWPVVFLPTLAEGHMPYLSGREDEPLRALESERRLLYVALTRAQKQLFITLPDTTADPAARCSRFVAEMNIEVSCAVGRAISEGASELTLPNAPGETVRRYLAALDNPLVLKVTEPDSPVALTAFPWRTGQKVRHSILGEGEVEAQDASRLHIRFADGKTRVFASDLAAPHLTLAG